MYRTSDIIVGVESSHVYALFLSLHPHDEKTVK